MKLLKQARKTRYHFIVQADADEMRGGQAPW